VFLDTYLTKLNRQWILLETFTLHCFCFYVCISSLPLTVSILSLLYKVVTKWSQHAHDNTAKPSRERFTWSPCSSSPFRTPPTSANIYSGRRLQFKQHVSELAASARATTQQTLQFTTDHRGREYSQWIFRNQPDDYFKQLPMPLYIPQRPHAPPSSGLETVGPIYYAILHRMQKYRLLCNIPNSQDTTPRGPSPRLQLHEASCWRDQNIF